MLAFIQMGLSLSRFVETYLPAYLYRPATSTIARTLPKPASPSPDSAQPSLFAAEEALLSHLTNSPYKKRSIHLPNSSHTLNTLSAGPPEGPALVVLHGWGAGLAFFGANVTGLSKHFRLHLVDWLGFGGSSRPAHPLGNTPADAEAFFVEPLAEWMSVMQTLEPAGFRNGRVHIVGHSMGAFLATAFALRYPHRVRNLVLASPVGVPKAPREKLTRIAGSRMRRAAFRALFTLWERGWTPQVLVRFGGAVLGRSVAAWMITRRFPAQDEAVQQAFVEYFYEISCATASGEYSLSTVLESGAYARRPLCDRLSDVSVPVAFLYGDRDWMSSDAAAEAAKGMKVKHWVRTVKGAGHNLYYDNAEEFNRVVIEACHQSLCCS